VGIVKCDMVFRVPFCKVSEVVFNRAIFEECRLVDEKG
jgi:hypothetical protein